MSAGAASRVLRFPGRLVVGPTDLTDPYPFGGVEVGRTRTVVLQSLGGNFRVMAEGLGEATNVLESEHHWVFSCFLRGWDDDAVEQLFGDNFTLGTASRHATVNVPGAAKPGASALPRAKVILYVPDDVVHAPAVLIYRGVPDWSEGAELAFQRREELGLPLAVECVRDTSDRILSIGRLVDLTL